MRTYKLTRKRDGATKEYDEDTILRFLLEAAGGGYYVSQTVRAMEAKAELDTKRVIERENFKLEVINHVTPASEVQATPR